MVEVTALGAALLAGLAINLYKDFDEIKKCVKENVIIIHPNPDQDYVDGVLHRWEEGIKRSLNLAE